MLFAYHNRQLVTEAQICLSPNNRGFRYADGFFETLKVVNGTIPLENLHLERLYSSLDSLKFDAKTFPDALELTTQIKHLVEQNNLEKSARIRITIFAGNGLLYEVNNRIPNYIIQTSPLANSYYPINDVGLNISFFKDAVKPFDYYSHLKSNNFLPYVMASLWAKEQQLDDALLLNSSKTVADSTIANLFIVKDGIIKTPPLSDGPVAGVMRRYLIDCFKKNKIPYSEASLNIDDILEASEVFLTNAISGIRWVKQIRNSQYSCAMIESIHEKFLNNLYV